MARKHRLQIPVSPETLKAIQTYATATGLSVPAACEQQLDNIAPLLVEIAGSLAKAKEAPSRALRQMAKTLERETDKAAQIGLELTEKPRRVRKRAS